MADGAGEFLVFVGGEREDGDEAEGEEGPWVVLVSSLICFCGMGGLG